MITALWRLGRLVSPPDEVVVRGTGPTSFSVDWDEQDTPSSWDEAIFEEE